MLLNLAASVLADAFVVGFYTTGYLSVPPVALRTCVQPCSPADSPDHSWFILMTLLWSLRDTGMVWVVSMIVLDFEMINLLDYPNL